MSNANKVLSSNQTMNTTYVSAEDLKNQVDELYEQFNKIAESLNITKAESDVTIGTSNEVKVSFFFPTFRTRHWVVEKLSFFMFLCAHHNLVLASLLKTI